MKEHKQHPQQDPIFAAWQTELKEASKRPWLASILLQRGKQIYGRFVHYYQALLSLSRRSRRNLLQKFAVSLGGLALAMAINGGPVLANNIAVTTTTHGINADGQCSLVEAIITANDTVDGDPFGADCADADFTGSDTIQLSGSTYNVDYAYGLYFGPTGLPTVTSDITIEGNGSTIQGVQPVPRGDGVGGDPFRLMAVGSGGSLTLDATTLQGGDAAGPGGGIFNNRGSVTLRNDTVVTNNNASGPGGGIFQYSYDTPANLTITDSTISGNFGVVGGGIYSYSYYNGSNVTINNSTVSGNSSLGPGGGVLNVGYLSAGVTLGNGSQISNNASYYAGGGGVANYSFYAANVTIQSGSTISGNRAGFGPAVPRQMPEGVVPIPPGAAEGGGVANRSFGGGLLLGTQATGWAQTRLDERMAQMRNTTEPAAPQGIVLPEPSEAVVTIENSVVTGNEVNGSGGGVSNQSGEFSAIYVVDNSAVTNNHALNVSSPLGGGPGSTNGGGLNNSSFACISCLPIPRTFNDHQMPAGGPPPFGTLSGVLIENSVVSGNTTDGNGGGIYNRAYGRAYIDLINGATVSDNLAYGLDTPRPAETASRWNRQGDGLTETPSGAVGTLPPLGFGGGVTNFSFYGGGEPPLATPEDIAGAIPGYSQLLVDNSTISGNTANFLGGGAGNVSYGVAYSNIRNGSTINDNESVTSYGGGVSNEGFYVGAVVIEASTISGNQADSLGGGMENYGGVSAYLYVNKSTVSGNSGNNGGGIYNGGYGGPSYASLSNSTISGNSATGHGGGIDVIGTLNLRHVTVTNNDAVDYAGGLNNHSGATNLYNSIVAGNLTGDCNGAVVSGGFNLDSDGTCITNGVNNDITAADPMLGPLQLNAPGSTATHTLVAGSPALDAIPSADPACGLLPDDQRGVARPQEAGCDIGAFERQIFTTFLPIIMNNPMPDLVITDLNVADGNLSVTIENQGTSTITNDFWVDLYLNPTPPPTAVNDVWDLLGPYGVAWGVTQNLAPGESLTLMLNDAFYDPVESNLPAIIPAGTVVYAQVDAAHVNTNYGAVLENHEVDGGVYNNISGPETTTSPITSSILNFVSTVKSWLYKS